MFVEFTFSMFASCKSRWLMNVEKKKSFNNSLSMFDMRLSSSISLLSCEAFHLMSFERTWWVEVRLRRFWWAERRLRNSWWVEKILKSSSWAKMRLKNSSWVKKRLNNSSWIKMRFEVFRLIEVRFETSWWTNRFFFKKVFYLLNFINNNKFSYIALNIRLLFEDRIFLFDSKNMSVNIIHYEII
jgi:hypothetical protein